MTLWSSLRATILASGQMSRADCGVLEMLGMLSQGSEKGLVVVAVLLLLLLLRL